jgi:DNA modification methylase
VSEYNFKSIYFPKERVYSGKSDRVNLSLPAKPNASYSAEFITHLKSLDSRSFRIELGDRYLEDLEEQATKEHRSLSNVCVSILANNFKLNGFDKPNRNNTPTQESLDFGSLKHNAKSKANDNSIGVTFKDSLRKGAFGWYPYVEGFSATYARDVLLRNDTKPRAIFDPFGGSGTTQLAASMLGIPSFYSELNPFMVFVAETKVTSGSWARNNLDIFVPIVDKFINEIKAKEFAQNAKSVSLAHYYLAFPDRDFFEENHLKELLHALSIAETVSNKFSHAKNLLSCACAANVVACSNMTRRADLRRRKEGEYKNRVVNVSKIICDSIIRMLEDIRQMPVIMTPMKKISSDAKSIPNTFKNSFDLILTSPPYLNGTNYFRNTKLELWFLSFIATEKDLKKFRELTVTGGINDVSKKDISNKFNSVELVAEKLEMAAKDKRIPTMVRQYFSDMSEVFDCLFNVLEPAGQIILDIGDSKFYGIHVPTHKLLIDVAKVAGLELINENVLARRVSRDKSELVQVELIFTKPKKYVTPTFNKSEHNKLELSEKIEYFQNHLPYKEHPYSKKTWGHKLHSLCSYQGKFKPAMAHWLVESFVPEKGSVIDPIGGVGTIPFEASMRGYRSVSNDKSPFAFQIAKAKLDPPSIVDFEDVVEEMKSKIARIQLNDVDYEQAKFGLNASVSDYYHANTLAQILKLRKYYLQSNIEEMQAAESFFWACLLHVLHGNRPYALSRTSHPITPFSPTGEAIDKDAFDKVLQKAYRSLKESVPSNFRAGTSLFGDFREIPNKVEGKFDSIITSPPFYGMRFDRPNWLRMWFCGWEEQNFKQDSLTFLERQQTKNLDVYKEFFETCSQIIKPDGTLVVHLGAGGKKDMAEDFKKITQDKFNYVGEVLENVQSVVNHGIKDKGYTKAHSLLFFSPK